MLDTTDSTDMTDSTAALNSTDGGVVDGMAPGSWVGITGTLPVDLPPANQPGNPAVAAAMAAAGGSSSSSSSSPPMSSSMKLAIAIGAGALVLGVIAVASSRRRR